MKPRIVLSGVNVSELGILAIFKDALGSLATEYSDQYEIIALVHRRDLYDVDGVQYLEFPKVKSSWARRVYFEYISSKKISLQFKPDIWLSMHDITPNVLAPVRAVYCHNATPFHPFRLSEALLDWKFGLFVAFYRFLYRINIRNNDVVIVQQQWLRKEFEKLYGVTNVVVAHPVVQQRPSENVPATSESPNPDQPYRFFYPAFPRPFKNPEVCLQAARILEGRGVKQFELWLTFDAEVNKYSAKLADRFSDVKSVRWLGRQSREGVFDLYRGADCLLFPSRLETWGLPISEFRPFGKPILAADLPYAHEATAGHHQVAFFNPDDPEQLANLMEKAATGKVVFVRAEEASIDEPFARNWSELWLILLQRKRARAQA